MSNPNTALAVKHSNITENGKRRISTDQLVNLLIFGVPARGVHIDDSGRLFYGHLYADPNEADFPTAHFTYYGGGESDTYMISPCDEYPGRPTRVRSMRAVIEKALEWMEPPQ